MPPSAGDTFLFSDWQVSVVSTHDMNSRQILTAFGITESELGAVAAIGALEQVDAAHLVRDFYTWLSDQPYTQDFFGGGVPDAVRTAQIRYWQEFLEGQVDDSYIESRIKVGATHARIGLPPVAYTSAMAFSQRWLFEKARLEMSDAADISAAIAGVAALCQLDSALVMDAYADHSNRRVQAEGDKLAAVHRELRRVVLAAAEGSFTEKYSSQTDDDSEIGEAVNQMVANFQQVIDQAKAIASGDYSLTIRPRSDQDELGRVIAEMTAALREATERTERDQWLKEGQADLFERIRGELQTSVLGRDLLVYLGQRLEAPVGCLYVPCDDGGLQLAAVYGCAGDDVPGRLRSGEGVLGEAAKQRAPVWNLDVSDTPIRGTFGLGEVVLPVVAIIPLESDGQLRGILELALKRPLPELHQEFLSLVSENIAIALNGAVARSQMETLLLQSRQQGNELKAQAEELRASNDELEERSRALERARAEVERSNHDLQEKQRTIEQASARLEERAQELVIASRYKSEFLANMSHELRTPLNSMLLLASSLCDNPEGNLIPKQMESLNIIRGAGNDLLRIINDVLDLSKVEAGKLAIEVQPTSVGSLLESLHGQFAPVAEQQGLALRVSKREGVPDTIATDPQRLEQVLRNLVGNALKFTHQGEVAVSVESETADRSRPDVADPRLIIAIKDTGIGIAGSQKKAIFEAFQQGDGSTSRTYGGTGLGLTISRQLVTLLGGQMHLESQPGQGSTFSVLLPIHGPDRQDDGRVPYERDSLGGSLTRPRGLASESLSQTPQEPPRQAVVSQEDKPEPEPEPSKPSLLVIEDDREFAGIVAKMAEEHGYCATTTTSGKEGLLLAEKLSPNGIILDLGLPDLDGMTALAQLKSNLKTRHMPVHVISGHDCKAETLEMGAMGFIQKPIEMTGLREILGRFEKLWTRESGAVLVVEEDPARQATVRELLAADGVTLDVVPTGEAGLKALRERSYDCVVLDVGLPDMSGDEFLGGLDDGHPPIIVYNAKDVSKEGISRLSDYATKVVIKGAGSPEHLLDEVNLFLHQVETTMSETQQASLQKLHERERGLTGRTVLVVDDDMRNMFALTELLQRQGVDVVQAKNGSVALQKLDENPDIDLVITDIMMPVMDGFETMRRLRMRDRFAALPVIAVTAKTLPEDRRACLEAGASDYIAKPMDPENLLSLMRVLLFDPQATHAENKAPSSMNGARARA